VNEYRVSYVRGRVPIWRIQSGDATDVALTPEDAIKIIGKMVISNYERSGGEFRVLWDGVPPNFSAPDVETINIEDVSLSH
jgi:hypothetical protein